MYTVTKILNPDARVCTIQPVRGLKSVMQGQIKSSDIHAAINK